MHFQFCAVALRYVRRCWYKLKRKRYKFMNFWNRFKWCLVGGFAYAAGRALFYFMLLVSVVALVVVNLAVMVLAVVPLRHVCRMMPCPIFVLMSIIPAPKR